MPEGPEAEYLQRLLQRHVKDRTITNIIIRRGRYYTHGQPFQLEMVENQKICVIHKKGKRLAIELRNSYFIVIELGLFGWLHIREKDEAYAPHDSVVFQLDNGKSLTFRDKVSFGTLTISKRLPFDTIAPDIMDSTTTFDVFRRRLMAKGKKRRICKALLDQTMSSGIISGCGNYLRAEALYVAQLSPYRECISLSNKECQRLFYSLKDRAYTSEPFIVYKRSSDPYGNPVIADNMCDRSRTIYWCPNYQQL